MTVALPRWVGRLSVFLLCIFLGSTLQAQERVITGKITDSKEGIPVIGATVTVKGTTIATSTEADGTFRLGGVPADAKTLVISSVGFATREVAISGTEMSITLTSSNADLNEVVVVGYGTARKKDLTGAVASVKAKDFNKGVVTAPDQLLQGKVAGVQILNNSGAPGAATTVRIRGNSSIRSGNQPLYVIDGVALDGRTARPGINAGGVGTIPGSNPLNFINNADILSMEVLKDASAAAIYGSRGANGVIIITTKKGSGGQKVDVNASVGMSRIMRSLDVLDGNEYRAALDKYGLTSGDYGDNVDAMDAITRSAFTQNYSVGVSGGNENGKYRISASYLNQDGIILKSNFKKYTAGINGSYKFLENKRLGLDFNVTVGHNTENAAPISNDAGFTGSIVGQALQWNPTHPLRFRASNGVDSLYIIPQFGSTSINPLVMSEAWDDISNTTNVMAYIAPSYNIADGLDYRFLYSINHQVSNRKNQIRSYLNLENIQNRGLANQANGTLTTTQMTHTLNYIKEIGDNITLSALGGYEYMKFRYLGNGIFGQDFANVSTPYYNYLQYTTQGSRQIGSFDQTSELQSFFARAILNFKDRYIFTGTFRTDGSSKFGTNNKYGYFPSLALAWNIHNEAFMEDQSIFDQLKFRASWGKTGNQEFPAFASQETYNAGQQSFNRATLENKDLKWETSTTINLGLDFSIAKGRLFGSVDYFNKKTSDILFDRDLADPVPVGSAATWVNLPGEILNSGVEVMLNYLIVKNTNFSWDFGVNATFLKNEITGFGGLVIPTGGLSGQGISGTNIQRFVNNRPLNAYYLRQFTGIDRDGQAGLVDGGASFFYLGDPNPDMLLGMTTNLSYKKFNLEISMNGAFGHQLYNNTANTVLPINNLGTRNIAKSLLDLDPQEALSSPITASSRYLEKGDYMKLSNATLSYNLGAFGSVVKGATLFLTGQNLFVITKFTGFDPEVNVDKNVAGRPSFGLEYIPYPTARNFIFGINFSF